MWTLKDYDLYEPPPAPSLAVLVPPQEVVQRPHEDDTQAKEHVPGVGQELPRRVWDGMGWDGMRSFQHQLRINRAIFMIGPCSTQLRYSNALRML